MTSTITTTIDNTSYDALGRRTQFQVKVGNAVDSTVDYGFSPDGIETTIKQSGTNVASKSVKYTRDSAGRLTQLKRYADLNNTEPVAWTEFEIDKVTGVAVDRTKSITHRFGTTILDQFNLTWDPANRLKKVETPQDGTSTFQYDLVDQLTNADYSKAEYTDLNFAYDANGNRQGSSYTTTADNQLKADDKATYEYDDNGNLIRRTLTNGSVIEYSFDVRDRLTDVKTRTSLSGPIIKQIHYGHDTLNRRISRSVRSSGSGPYESVEYFVNDGSRSDSGGAGDEVVLTLDQAGLAKKRFLHGLAVDEVLAEEKVVSGTSADVLWYLSDQQGSVRDLVRHDSTSHATTVVKHIMYDAFGNTIAETDATGGAIPATDTALAQMFGYTGRELDKDTGLQYNRARWYDPSTGRLLSKDPIGFAAGDANLYRMTGNHPNMATDPSGLEEWDPRAIRMIMCASLGDEFTSTFRHHVSLVANDGDNPVVKWFDNDVNGYGRHLIASYPKSWSNQQVIDAVFANTWGDDLLDKAYYAEKYHPKSDPLDINFLKNIGDPDVFASNQRAAYKQAVSQIAPMVIDAMRNFPLFGEGAYAAYMIVDGRVIEYGTGVAKDYYSAGATVLDLVKKNPGLAATGTVAIVVGGKIIAKAVDNAPNTVNGRKIINSDFANTTRMTKGGVVHFDSNGFPDFTPYSMRTVRVDGLTGKMSGDIAAAMKKAGMETYDEAKFVWHHHQDGKSMMLVPRDVHSVRNGGVGHTGGRAVIQHNLDNPANPLIFPSPPEK